MTSDAYGYRFRRKRAELLASSPLCVWCGLEPAVIADHYPPLSMHEHRSGVGCCELVPSCRRCSQLQAGRLGGRYGRP
jgi:hypothetical protein